MHARVSEIAIRKIILTLTQIRIGEAKNPGPDNQPGFTLAAINPTGLLRKASNFSQLPSASNVIYGICETHLTAMGIRKFKTELKFANKNLSFFHGAAAPYRSQAITAVGGTHVGTGFATSLPSRKIQMHCPQDTWNQARFCFNTFLCNNVWVHGAVVYGFAHRAYATEVRQATDDLLQVATSHIVQNLRGPRFIMGDFNQEEGMLPQTQIWEKLGWREVQVLQSQRFGTKIEKTCKQSTTKDFIWVSPELALHFHHAEVINHVYPEHAALLAHFHDLGGVSSMRLWRQPKAIPWEDIHSSLDDAGFHTHHDLSPEASCIQIAQELEDRVHAKLIQQQHRGLHNSSGADAKQLPPAKFNVSPDRSKLADAVTLCQSSRVLACNIKDGSRSSEGLNLCCVYTTLGLGITIKPHMHGASGERSCTPLGSQASADGGNSFPIEWKVPLMNCQTACLQDLSSQLFASQSMPKSDRSSACCKQNSPPKPNTTGSCIRTKFLKILPNQQCRQFASCRTKPEQ